MRGNLLFIPCQQLFLLCLFLFMGFLLLFSLFFFSAVISPSYTLPEYYTIMALFKNSTEREFSYRKFCLSQHLSEQSSKTLSLYLLQHKARCSCIFNLQIERRKIIHLNEITPGGDCICINLKERSQSCLHQVFPAWRQIQSGDELSHPRLPMDDQAQIYLS